LEEIEGYNIEEPIGEEIRYHVMFSAEFGKNRKALAKKAKEAGRRNLNDPQAALEAFLEKHYVWVQSYQITEELQYINKPLKGFKLINQKKKKVDGNRKHLPELIPLGGFHQREIRDPVTVTTKDKQTYSKRFLADDEGYEFEVHVRENKEYEVHQYPIQFIGHKIDPETNDVIFVAFDSFHSHHFTMSPGSDAYGAHTIYYGNNEFHLQSDQKEIIKELGPRWSEEWEGRYEEFEEELEKYEDELHKSSMPFLKHLNA